MECTKQQVCAARSDLGVPVEPRRGESAGRKLDADDDAGRHVFEESGVNTHNFDIANILGVEGHYPSERPGIGGQSAVDSRYPHHHAPIAIEIVTEADVVPLRIDFLV